MKNRNKMWAIALFGLFVVVMSSGIQTVSAGPLGGGDSFENATEIVSGYSAEAYLSQYDEDFFYIMVNPGQTLVVEGSIVTGNKGVMYHSIYDEDKSPLNAHCFYGPFKSDTMLWSPNSAKDSYKCYLKAKCTDGAQSLSRLGGCQYNINASLVDHYDANSGTDAGDTFDTAMNITQGSYDGFLAGSGGNDHKDFYKLALESGEKINVKLTPSENVKLNLKIYNEDRAEEKFHTIFRQRCGYQNVLDRTISTGSLCNYRTNR